MIQWPPQFIVWHTCSPANHLKESQTETVKMMNNQKQNAHDNHQQNAKRSEETSENQEIIAIASSGSPLLTPLLPSLSLGTTKSILWNNYKASYSAFKATIPVMPPQQCSLQQWPNSQSISFDLLSSCSTMETDPILKNGGNPNLLILLVFLITRQPPP